MTKFNTSYFLKFFSGIPRNKWITGAKTIGDTHCAVGHAEGGKFGCERRSALQSLFWAQGKNVFSV